MGTTRRSMLVGGLMALALAGCGAGDRGAFGDYFGSGGGPGSVFTQVHYGALAGLVLLRTADQRVLVVPQRALAAGETAVVGCTVTVGGLGLQAVTGADGRYAIANVPAGEYDVSFAMPVSIGGPPAVFHVQVTADQTLQGVPSP